MAMQTISNEQVIRAARYSFLAKPPPPQKKKLIQAPPSPPIPVVLPLSAAIPPSPPPRHRASNIAAWAALVQPGSPAPQSPHRRPSTSSSRRSSLTRVGRRPSISHSRAPSGSLSGLIHTPTSAQDIDINLSAFGYTSVFVHVPPKTPSTPSHLARTGIMKTPVTPATASIQPPSPKKTTRTIKRFRSLGILRPRGKSTSRAAALPSPTKNTALGVRARSELIAKRKKAKYAHVRPPPLLANEIALMQFADGGSVESNVRKIMEAQAHANGGGFGVGDVYRDGKGGIWLDQDEEMEYAHLLGGDLSGENATEGQWIKFGNDENEDDISPKTGIIDLAESKRESVSTQDSDLDPTYLILPAEETQCGPEDVVLSFAMPPKSPFKKNSPVAPGLSVLSLPSRPHRAAKHLRKPEFLIDVAAFGPRSPGIQIRISPKSSGFPSTPASARNTSSSSSPYNSPRTPRTPRSARFSSAFVLPPVPSKGKKIKRRPAPLKLAPVSAGWKKIEASRTPQSVAVSRVTSGSALMSSSSAGVVAEARREFVEASFAPKPIFHRVPKPSVPTPVKEEKPQRGKIIIASLDPMDDMVKCREWAGMMMMDKDIDVEMDASKNSGSVPKKKRLGLGGLFGRK